VTIHYLIVGALTRDLQPASGWQPGGSGWYAAQQVARWGYSAAVATPLMSRHLVTLPPSIALFRIPSPQTTTFFNHYTGDQRIQQICAVPDILAWEAVPPPWRSAGIVHLAPLAHELLAIPPRSVFPQALIGLTAQGWLRAWDPAGRITPQSWQPTTAALGQVDVIVVSEEDVGGAEDQVQQWAQAGPIVALTRGSAGVTVWHSGTRSDIAAYPITLVDPTGAGDIWAAAFFTQLYQQVAVVPAAEWACRAAALAIGSPPGEPGLAE
jgi:sugar/nucleoside kinase (ribokinase family)